MQVTINVALSYTPLAFAQANGLVHPSPPATGSPAWRFATTTPKPTGTATSFNGWTGTPTVRETVTMVINAEDRYGNIIGTPQSVTVEVFDPAYVEPVPEPEPEPVPEPTGPRTIAEEVAAALDRDGDPDTIKLAETHVPLVTVFVRSYTRGRGFLEGAPNDDLRAVIISATTRWTVNAEQSRQYSAGDYSESGATLTGFSLLERHVLNLYRRRAA